MTKVVGLLKNHKERKCCLEVLAFRLNQFSELISVGTKAAEDYKEELQELTKRYRALKSELDLLDYCITLLDKELAEVTTDLLINNMNWQGVCSKYKISKATLGRYRQKAVKELTELLEEELIVRELVVREDKCGLKY